MMTRFKLALRLLLGGPVRELQVSEATPLSVADAPGFDCTKQAPSVLVLGGLAENKPPVEVFEEERFRVCVFAGTSEDFSEPCRWLVLELHTALGWSQLMTLHESRLQTMIGVLQDVGDYLNGYHVASDNMRTTRDLARMSPGQAQ